MNGVVAVRIKRGNMVFHVHGDQAGREGVWLAEGQVQGIYDAPVTTTYKTGAFQVGSRYKGMKRNHRDMVLGFHVADTVNSYEFNESAFRQAFQYQLDPWDADRTPTTIEVETELSGVRCLDVLMYEQPEFESKQDPVKHQYGNLLMKLRAPNPDWYEPDYTAEFASTATQATVTIIVENHTDQVAYQRFVLTRALWSLPDCQWIGAPAYRLPGGEQGERQVTGIDITDVNGGAVVDWDRSQLAFRDATGTNLQGQIGQRFLVYPIPPHTPPTALPISYDKAPAGGAMARLEVPQRWSRPWGMELQDAVSYQPPLGTTRFTTPGSFTYVIPAAATHLDIVMLGGGGGGAGGNLVGGFGGAAGKWASYTLERGKDIPMGESQIEGVVGGGGDGGDAFQVGGNGEVTLFTAGSVRGTAAGGLGSGNTALQWGLGVDGPTYTYNGAAYTGGAEQYIASAVGNAPGGGGAGGFTLIPGGDGARGQVWIRAYRVES